MGWLMCALLVFAFMAAGSLGGWLARVAIMQAQTRTLQADHPRNVEEREAKAGIPPMTTRGHRWRSNNGG